MGNWKTTLTQARHEVELKRAHTSIHLRRVLCFRGDIGYWTQGVGNLESLVFILYHERCLHLTSPPPFLYDSHHRPPHSQSIQNKQQTDRIQTNYESIPPLKNPRKPTLRTSNLQLLRRILCWPLVENLPCNTVRVFGHQLRLYYDWTARTRTRPPSRLKTAIVIKQEGKVSGKGGTRYRKRSKTLQEGRTSLVNNITTQQ